MKIFCRIFNDSINSKTGYVLPPDAPRRGTPEWTIFQKMLLDSLQSLGHDLILQPEHPVIPDGIDYDNSPDKKIYVHLTKKEKPNGDLFWMQMHMRELFTVDTNGWGADHSGNKQFNPQEIDQDEATKFCEEKSKQLLESKVSKCEQPSITSTTPHSFILVPVQIPRDYTIKNHSPITVRYFIESIQAWAIETETQVCFKMHPHNKVDKDLHEIIEQAQANSQYVRKVEGNIHELIRRSDGVLVINSGTGFESLLHGKPVATIGDCDYNLVTLNADIRRLNEVSYFFSEYKDEYKQLAYKYIWWYWNKHAYDVNSKETPRRLSEYFKGAL